MFLLSPQGLGQKSCPWDFLYRKCDPFTSYSFSIVSVVPTPTSSVESVLSCPSLVRCRNVLCNQSSEIEPLFVYDNFQKQYPHCASRRRTMVCVMLYVQCCGITCVLPWTLRTSSHGVNSLTMSVTPVDYKYINNLTKRPSTSILPNKIVLFIEDC